jgi:hypothetical protein
MQLKLETKKIKKLMWESDVGKHVSSTDRLKWAKKFSD